MTRFSPCVRGCFVLSLILATGLAAGSWAQQPAVPDSGPAVAGLASAKALSRAFVNVARKITPTVVNISSTRVERSRTVGTSSLFRRFFPEFDDLLVDPTREVRSLGSGVIIRPDGYIATNWHVVQGAQEITVTLSDNREFAAKIVGQDALTDLAVIKVEGENLPVAQFGDSTKLQVGEWVIAVGSPLGLAQTVTAGIVSAVGRKNLGIQGLEDFIQTDAAINPGNSGGALVNLDGQVVGINTAIATEGGGYDGICFATPTSAVWPVVDALVRDGKIRRPWTGILPQTVNARIARRLGLDSARGVLIGNMVRGGPADLAHLRPGDVILKWGGADMKSRADLSETIQREEIGASVEVIIQRGAKKYRATLKISERPQNIQTKGVL